MRADDDDDEGEGETTGESWNMIYIFYNVILIIKNSINLLALFLFGVSPPAPFAPLPAIFCRLCGRV